MSDRWSRDVVALTAEHAGPDQRLAVDRCEPWLAQRLRDAGITLFDAQVPAEEARRIKTAEELQCIRLAMDVCDVAVGRMREALRPGITENQLWAVLHETNIAHDGEWIECRLLASGPRTNPWFQECSNRVIEAGDLVGFDTDMIGPNGYLADISRTLLCPGRPPSASQRRLYELAQEQVLTNIDVLRPGMTLREFSERCWPVPERYLPNRYMLMVHGAGLVDESPGHRLRRRLRRLGLRRADRGGHGVVRGELHRRRRRTRGREAGGAGAGHRHGGGCPVVRSTASTPSRCDRTGFCAELSALSAHKCRQNRMAACAPWRSPCCCAPMVPNSPTRRSAAGLAVCRPADRAIVATVVEAADPMLAVGTGMAGGVMSADEVERMQDDRTAAARALLDATCATPRASSTPRR